jgi:beta-phosphoglucomutase-like phosphatase (HAD superfamily)
MRKINVLDYFEVVVGGDEVHESKPSPIIYLRAAELLGVKPEECVVVEDSPNGIRSGVRAGMEVLGVRNEENAHLDLSFSKDVSKIFYKVKEYLEKFLRVVEKQVFQALEIPYLHCVSIRHGNDPSLSSSEKFLGHHLSR